MNRKLVTIGLVLVLLGGFAYALSVGQVIPKETFAGTTITWQDLEPQWTGAYIANGRIIRTYSYMSAREDINGDFEIVLKNRQATYLVSDAKTCLDTNTYQNCLDDIKTKTTATAKEEIFRAVEKLHKMQTTITANIDMNDLSSGIIE